MEQDISRILFEIMVILVFAKLGAYVFECIKQPAVLGELLVGILIGNLEFFSNGSITIFSYFRGESFIHTFSEIGVIILLFEIGLQSEIGDLLKVGWPSFRVAIVGVIIPFALGFWLTTLLGLSDDFRVSLFLGATLTATSVGITARVLRDLKKLGVAESKVILGAAVIDDVLGLVVLAIVTGIVTTGAVDTTSILLTSGYAFGFLVGAIVLGRWLAPFAMALFRKMEVKGLKITVAIGIAFFFSFIAHKVGLAPIVGAFAAGLILDDIHFSGFNEKRKLEDMISPLSEFFVPIFFVVVGSAVRLDILADWNILAIGGVLTGVAILGKYVAGWAALPRKMNFNAIGLGMIPRGEVGLIFASEGRRIGVISEKLFAIVIFLVMVTTLITPPLLGMAFKRTRSPSTN